MLVGGGLSVSAGGTLDMGASGSPIPSATTASLTLAYGSFAGQYGLIVNPGGNFLVYGAVKTPWTLLTNPGAIGPGAAGTFTVGDTTGWQAGDTITIGTEAVTIATLPGSNQVTINQNLGQAHAIPTVVADLTEGVRGVLPRVGILVFQAPNNGSHRERVVLCKHLP